MNIPAQIFLRPLLLICILICVLAIPGKAFARESGVHLANADAIGAPPRVEDSVKSVPRRANDACTTICYVDEFNGDDANSGKTSSDAKKTIGAAVAQVTPGGDVIVAGGFYAESAVVIDKPLSITGVSRLTTLVDGGGNDVFLVRSGGVQIQGLTIQNGSRALVLQQLGPPLDSVTLSDVRLNQNSAAGVDVAADTAVRNLTIESSILSQNMVGVTLGVSSTVDGLNILGTSILDGMAGLMQQNDGSNGKLENLRVVNANFSNNATVAMQLQELSGGLIEETTFSGNGKGIVLDKQFTSSNQSAGNIVIRQNEFLNQRGPSISVSIKESGLEAPLEIRGNQFTQPANLLTTTNAVLLLQLGAGSAHGEVTVEDNDFILSGLPATGVDAIFGVQLAGSVDSIKVLRNRFNGGNVGGSGDSPATSAIYVQSADNELGAPDANTRIAIEENSITGFVNGVSVYDPVANGYGGLPAGTVVRAAGNNIAGNSGFGVANGEGETLSARENWWGNPSGPGGAAPGTGDRVTSGVDYCPWLDQTAPQGMPVSPSGSYATTSTDGHTTEYCTIEEALFASQGSNQTVLVQPGNWGPEHFNRSYLDSPDVTVRSVGPEAATVEGLLLSEALFSGLTLRALTFVGEAPDTAYPYQIVIDRVGTYEGLCIGGQHV